MATKTFHSIRATMISAYVLPLLVAGLAWQSVHAAPLYKWVDAQGQVTYSSAPPPTGTQARRVAEPPPPASGEILQAEEQAQRAKKLADELAEQRRQKEAEEAERRKSEPPAPPVVVEQPVYVPQPALYAPAFIAPPRRHHDKGRDHKDDQPRRR